MYLFMIEATPGPDAELGEEAQGETVAGAYINCWIDFKNLQGAEQLAYFYIRNQGWVPGDIHEVSEVDLGKDHEDSTEFVSEAAEIGYSLVFNCYPPDTEDDTE